MPKGSPNKQTIASAKWHKKAGYKTKAFNLKGDLADRFAVKCEEVGKSQAAVISELMEEYISRCNTNAT